MHKTLRDLLRESRPESRTGLRCCRWHPRHHRRTLDTAIGGHNCPARSSVITQMKYPLGYYSDERSAYRMEISHVSIRHLQSLPKNHVDGLRSTRGTGNARSATQPTLRRARKRKINRLILVPAPRALTATPPNLGSRRSPERAQPRVRNSWLSDTQIEPQHSHAGDVPMRIDSKSYKGQHLWPGSSLPWSTPKQPRSSPLTLSNAPASAGRQWQPSPSVDDDRG